MANPTLPTGGVTGSFFQPEATTSSSSITYADSGIGYLSGIGASGAGEKQLEDFDLQEDEALQELFPEYSLSGIHIKKEPEDFDDYLQPVADSGLNTPPSSVTVKSEQWEDISVEGQPFTMEQLLDSNADDFPVAQPSDVKFTYKNAIISCLQGGKNSHFNNCIKRLKPVSLILLNSRAGKIVFAITYLSKKFLQKQKKQLMNQEKGDIGVYLKTDLSQ
ncbi:hypothetical protein [Kistimonas asteriae]|uniref:hypothetical protein n=1 Tax=Kistimonas asteriae TaxID=517724 RepID=UPI001BAB49AE|nr:hypothetical protein [Kistimonas asteriae]